MHVRVRAHDCNMKFAKILNRQIIYVADSDCFAKFNGCQNFLSYGNFPDLFQDIHLMPDYACTSMHVYMCVTHRALYVADSV